MCLINFCDQSEINLLKALEDKLHLAEKKYPIGRVKGKALKYNEYEEWSEE